MAVFSSPVVDAAANTLTELWGKIEKGVTDALEARENDRTETLESRLSARRDREISDVTKVMQDLAARIDSELAEPEGQLELFTLDERQQLERDVVSLQARLDRIPAEIERETDRIRRRYSEADPRLFPFAVLFLVPRSIAGGAR